MVSEPKFFEILTQHQPSTASCCNRSDASPRLEPASGVRWRWSHIDRELASSLEGGFVP